MAIISFVAEIGVFNWYHQFRNKIKGRTLGDTPNVQLSKLAWLRVTVAGPHYLELDTTPTGGVDPVLENCAPVYAKVF